MPCKLCRFMTKATMKLNRKELLVDEAGNPILDDNNKQQFSNIIPSHNWGI